MKANVLLSSALHIILLAALIFFRPGTRKFEGYPSVLPVELVELEPVSYKAPEVKKVAPKREKPKPKPKKLEGVTVEKKKVAEKPEEQQPKQEETPEESDEGNSTVSSETMRLDVKEFPYSYYQSLLRSRMQANWEPPAGSQTSLSRSAIIYFKIKRNGHVMNIVIEKGSGDALFDRAAIRAVTLASPLPPLPFDFPERVLGVHFEFAQGR